MGYSKGNLSHWKKGNAPNGDIVINFAKRFGVTTDYLLCMADFSTLATSHDDVDISINKECVTMYRDLKEIDILMLKYIYENQPISASDIKTHFSWDIAATPRLQQLVSDAYVCTSRESNNNKTVLLVLSDNGLIALSDYEYDKKQNLKKTIRDVVNHSGEHSSNQAN